MEVKENIDNEPMQYANSTERKIYEKNRELNKQRIGFFTFLMNSTKGEMAFDIRSLTLLFMLSGLLIIYRKTHKKSLGAIKLLGISALLGIIVFMI